MKSVFGRLCFAAVFVLAVVSGTPSLAAPQPWSEREIAEAQAIQNGIISVLKDFNAAIAVADSDPAKACEPARASAQKVDTIIAENQALLARLRAEQKDSSKAELMAEKLVEVKQRLAESVQSICEGDFKSSSDPEVKAMQDKVMVLMRRYLGDVQAAVEAESRNDNVTACRSGRDAVAALDELDAYLVTLIQKYQADPAGVAEIQKLRDQLKDYRQRSATIVKGDCTAS